MRQVRQMFASPLVQVADVTCFAPQGGCAPEEHSATPQIVIPRRGVFSVHRGRRMVVADAMTAMVLHGGYRISHPGSGGDRCVALTFTHEVHDEALGAARILRAPQRISITRTTDPLLAEEQAVHTLAELAGAPRLKPTHRIEVVRELLAARPAERWTLSGIGRAVHTSPYHLARQFRASTGQTIARYLTELRLAIALDRLQDGEDDLARLAADLGFAGHSHFTERFRRAYGKTPSQMRTILTAPRVAPA